MHYVCARPLTHMHHAPAGLRACTTRPPAQTHAPPARPVTRMHPPRLPCSSPAQRQISHVALITEWEQTRRKSHLHAVWQSPARRDRAAYCVIVKPQPLRGSGGSSCGRELECCVAFSRPEVKGHPSESQIQLAVPPAGWMAGSSHMVPVWCPEGRWSPSFCTRRDRAAGAGV